MKITPVERALRIKQLRDKKALEHAEKVRARAGRIAGRRGRKKKTATGKPRRARGSLSREEIIQAAEEIMVTEGVEALSMRRVAEKLVCSVASPYAHFKNQEEIMRELIVRGEQTLIGALQTARASSPDVYLQLAAIAHAYWKFANENRERHRLMFTGAGGRLYRKAFPTLPRSYRVLLETVRHGVDTGEIPYTRESYPAIARTMWAWMYGLIVLDLNGMMRYPQGVDPVEEGIVFLTRMLRGGEHPKFDRRSRQAR
ncbi:MAG: TetR/AcrR family transcriptional regulator [Leptospiraceae bacterium]|nr:TetR/AcrR family transcriptional regulator [Leptospiraceae bacterium]